MRYGWQDEGGEDRYLDAMMEDRLSGLSDWTVGEPGLDLDGYTADDDEYDEDEGDE
jgi:hypothetical protein